MVLKASTPAANPFEALEAQTLADYTAMLADAAQGKKVDPTAALTLAMAAGRSAAELRQDVATMTERCQADREFTGRDWVGEIAALWTTRKTAAAKLTTAQATAEAANQALREAHIADERAMSLHGSAQRLQGVSQKAFRDTLRKSGDPSDWRAMRIGPPVEVATDDYRAPINVGYGAMVTPAPINIGL